MQAEAKALPGEVVEVRARIDAWRTVRKGGSKMPEELWVEAVALAQELGIARISRALGVCDRVLSRRIKERRLESGDSRVRVKGHAEPVRFVDLGGERCSGSLPAGPMVELIRAEGTRLVVRLAPGSVVDVASLVRAFRD